MVETKQPTTWDELLATSDKPILVDFWAEWCGPCHMVAPVIKAIAKDYAGRLTVVKINVDERPNIAARYSIQSIPTLMIFDEGEVVWRQSGALSYPAIAEHVNRFVQAV
jgi:thioredoxin